MLFGANTTKPDVHICRYVSSAVGQKLSPIAALVLLEEVAAVHSIRVRDLDTMIWERSARGTEGTAAGGVGSAPSLRPDNSANLPLRTENRVRQRDSKYVQPNSKYVSRENLPVVHREHYDVARSFHGPFTRADFLKQYGKMFPQRTEGSIIPSDYCFNRENKGNAMHPRFLWWEDSGKYAFVGLRGECADQPG